jgi:tetratricopeptide (TPR) repeat protein
MRLNHRTHSALALSTLLLGALLFSACGESRTWEQINEAAKTAHGEGQVDLAESEFKAALAEAESLGDQDPQQERQIKSLNNLGEFERSRGRMEPALEFYTRAFEARKAVVGDDSPELGVSHFRLGTLHQEAGKLSQAIDHFERALEIRRGVLGEDHPLVNEVLAQLGTATYLDADYEASRAWTQQALTLIERTEIAMSPSAAIVLTNLGQAEAALGEMDAALASFLRAEKITEANFGTASVRAGRAKINRAEVLSRLERHAEAERLYVAALRIYEMELPPNHPELNIPLNNLGMTYRALERYDDAEKVLTRVIEAHRGFAASSKPDLAVAIFNLARVHAAQSDTEQAELLYREALEIYSESLGHEHPNVLTMRQGFAEFLRAQGRGDEAEQLLNAG